MYHLIIAQNSLYKNTHGAHLVRTICALYAHQMYISPCIFQQVTQREGHSETYGFEFFVMKRDKCRSS